MEKLGNVFLATNWNEIDLRFDLSTKMTKTKNIYIFIYFSWQKHIQFKYIVFIHFSNEFSFL